MSSDATEALFKTIDERRDELVELTRALIRIPTVNPPGEAYRACAEFIGQRLRRARVRRRVRACGRHAGRQRPLSAHQRHRAPRRARRAGPCVHFNGHIDVVQAGSGWTVDPFAAVVRDGRVYGRGACDMKGGLAASIIAAEALIDSGAALPGAIEISGTGRRRVGRLRRRRSIWPSAAGSPRRASTT